MVIDQSLAKTVKKDGVITIRGDIVVHDGKARTVSTSGTDSKGKKFKSTAVHDKR